MLNLHILYSLQLLKLHCAEVLLNIKFWLTLFSDKNAWNALLYQSTLWTPHFSSSNILSCLIFQLAPRLQSRLKCKIPPVCPVPTLWHYHPVKWHRNWIPIHSDMFHTNQYYLYLSLLHFHHSFLHISPVTHPCIAAPLLLICFLFPINLLMSNIKRYQLICSLHQPSKLHKTNQANLTDWYQIFAPKIVTTSRGSVGSF